MDVNLIYEIRKLRWGWEAGVIGYRKGKRLWEQWSGIIRPQRSDCFNDTYTLLDDIRQAHPEKDYTDPTRCLAV